MSKKLSKKQVAVMLAIMVCLVLLYLIFSGSFRVYSSYQDVLSTAKHTELAAGDGWKLCVPEKEGLTPYFVYEGEQHPKTNISMKAIFYEKDGHETKGRVDAWYPICDRHFFFGERRYYLPEGYEHLTGIACKVLWNEYRGGENQASYIFSEGLTMEQQQSAMEEIDDLREISADSFPI